MDSKIKLNYKCAYCGVDMYVKPSRIKNTERICCSMVCSSKLRKQYMTGSGNHQYGLKGEGNPTYSGRKTKIKLGYVFVRDFEHPHMQEHGWVQEHRLVAEQYLLNKENSILIEGKMYLRPELVVHHKDFNKKNNQVENLEIMTLEEHTRIHNLINPKSRDKFTGRFVKKVILAEAREDLVILEDKNR